MRRASAAASLTILGGLAAAGVYWTLPAGLIKGLRSAEATTEGPSDGRVLYYRHPDGRPSYSLEPRRTEDGRDWRAVRAGEDPETENPAAPRSSGTAVAVPGARTGPDGQRRPLFYRNPMGLPDTSPVPRKDSMGMDYIPVYEGGDADDGSVRVPPGRLQAAGVRSEPAVRRVVSRVLRAPGTVQLDERRITVVSLRAEAFVERVEDVTTGDRVRRGQPLLRIYSPEVAAAAAQYISALSISTGLGGTNDGARRRLENLAVPPAVLAEVERSRRAPLSFVLPAPRDGVVLERSAVEGMRATAGEVLFRIADTSLVWVLVDVPERDIGNVGIGGPVTVRVRSLGDRSLAGRIALVYPQVDMGTRTGRLRVELPNPDGALMPGMFAEADIAVGGEAPVVAVPNGAVIETGTRQVVLLDRGEGRFEPRDVRGGRRGEGWTEIREGVAEGDRVVVAANFLIDSESNLRAALRGLATGREATR